MRSFSNPKSRGRFKAASLVLLALAVLVLTLGTSWTSLVAGLQALAQPSQQALTPCFRMSKQEITVEFLGYTPQSDGTTTLTLRLTNQGQRTVEALGFRSNKWLAVAPGDNTRYSGALGDYDVRWALHNLTPSQEAFRFQPQGTWLQNGASETFVLTVRGFDPQQLFKVWVRVGSQLVELQDRPSQYTCLAPPTPSPTPTLTPTATPFVSPLPTPTSTPVGYTLPAAPVVAACLFTPPAGGVIEEPTIPLSAYTFSAPQVVLTNTAPIGIQQWLPDSERLLVTLESLSSQLVSVALVNTTTGEVSAIVEPRKYLREPRWVAKERTVIWRELGSFQDTEPGYWEPGYWVRSFDPPGERRLSGNGNGASISHDVSPDGKQVVFMSLPGGTQPLIWNQESKTMRALPVDFATWRYQKANFLYPFRPFNAHWQPAGEKILFEDGVWLFLYDLTTNRGCEINMQTLSPIFPSVYQASWSPNGRYLLLQIALDPPYTSFRGPYGTVLVLDTYTGETTQYSLGNAVQGFSWAPDNQTVAMSGLTGQKIGRFDMHGIYLLNIHSGEYRQILPERNLANVQWSSDGARLVFHCQDYLPDENGQDAYPDQICISQVTMNH